MSLDSDVIVDRRRMRRKLTFWRVVAALVAIAAIVTVGVVATPGGRSEFATSGSIARVNIEGLIRSDQNRVEALERLVDERPGLRLLVAGPGDGGQALSAMPARVASRVTMLGQVSDADKARVLRSVDLYVASNTGGESFGIVLTEALAAGTAVVASDLEGFRRVLDNGSCARLVPPGDPVALAAAVAELLDDPAARRAIAAAGARCVERFDWARVVADVVAVYETVVAGPAADEVRIGRFGRLVGMSGHG